MSSKKKYHTQTQAINNPWDIGNTLKGCIYQYNLNRGSNLATIFKATAEDSLTGKLNNLAKLCQPGGRYADVLGTPTGTLITKPLTKASFELGANINCKEVLSTQLIRPCEDFFKHLVENYLVDNYQYDGTTVTLPNEDGEDTQYPLLEVYLEEDTHTIWFTYATYRWVRTGTGTSGPTFEKQTIKHNVDTNISFTGNTEHQYLLVSYLTEEGETLWYYWDTETENDTFTSWLKDNKVLYYPSFFFRKGKNSIKREDPEYFEVCKKAFKRLNLDFEDLVDSYNGEANLNQETDEDKDYRDSLKNVTDIAMTFALDITVNDQRVMRYIYEFAKFMYKTSGVNSNRIDYTHKALNYDFSWNRITREIKTGRVNVFHRFTTEAFDERIPVHIHIPGPQGGSDVDTFKTVKSLRICKQLDNNQYEEYVISGVNFATYNNGHRMSRTLPNFKNVEPLTQKEIQKLKNKSPDEDDDDESDNESNECLIPIIPVIINTQIGAIVGGDILAISMRSVHNTYVKIKKKWWQSSWFLVVRIIIYVIVIIIVTIYTCGSGTAPTMKAIFSIEALIQLAIVIAIKLLWKIICKVCHINGATAAIVDTLIDIFAIYVLPCMTASSTTTTATGAVTSVGSTAVTTTTTVVTTTTLSTLASSMIVSVANMIVAGRVDLNTIANSLSVVAVNGLMNISPIAGSMLDLSTNPQFYYAVQTKDWTGMVSCMSSTLLKAMGPQLGKDNSFINITTGELGSQNTNLLPSFSNAFNMDSLTSVANSYGQAKEQETQNKLSQLNNSMLSLGKLMQAQEKYSALLAHNNTIGLGLILDLLTTDSSYNFYKIAGTIKAPKIS